MSSLDQMTDGEVFDEAARRLRKQFFREYGKEFLFGHFRFVFHNGRFQGIEDWLRNKRYASSNRYREPEVVA